MKARPFADGRRALALLALVAVPRPSLAADDRPKAEPSRSVDVALPPALGLRSIPAPQQRYVYVEPQLYPTLAWVGAQLLPSPEVGGGRVRRDGVDTTALAFGLRWQLTPLLFSWGTNRRVARWRTFVVDPIARNSGSLELDTSFEYLFGHIDRMLVRPGVRATFPLAHRGEYLSASLGTSVYRYEGTPRVAYDVGAYVLFGLFGVQLTVAPAHAPLNLIGTLRIRYF